MTTKPRDTLRRMVREARLSIGQSTSAPAIAAATLRMFRADIRDDPDLFDAVARGFLTSLEASMLKEFRSEDGEPHALREQQLALWPESARAVVEIVGREHVFVPSRDEYVELVPDALSPAEMIEAGAYLIGKGRDCIRRGEALLRLAGALDGAAGGGSAA